MKSPSTQTQLSVQSSAQPVDQQDKSPLPQLPLPQPKNNKDKPRFDHWRFGKLYQKIGYGYLVSISLGCLGSLLGVVIADFYQGQSLVQLLDAQEQYQILVDFERSTEAFQLHSTRLFALTDQPQRLQEEYAFLRQESRKIQQLQQQLDAFLVNQPAWVAVTPDQMRQLVQTYATEIETCLAEIESAIADPSLIADPSTTSAKLKSLAGGEMAMQFDQHQQELISILDAARRQDRQAFDLMEEAQGVEKLIIGISVGLAMLTAALMAWRTTRAIAQPIEQVTQVAQHAAIESNFHLRVPVKSQDEVGLLAQALNLLIQRVEERTHDLEQTAQYAEQQAESLQTTLERLRKTQAQLVQTEKMSSLGQMIAGVAHEINNPVSFIHGNLTYAKKYVEDLLSLVELYQTEITQPPLAIQQKVDDIDLDFVQSDLPKLLSSLEVGTERIRSIVLSLRVFSRLQEAEMKAVNLHDGIDSTLIILNSRLKAQPNRPEIKLTKQYGDLPLVDCYAGQLNQVFMNLLANAIDALEEKYEQIRPTQPDWRPNILIRTQAQNNQVTIKIIDNGSGIPEKIQSKIFDPFFTTKRVGKGTGLGMSISYEIVVEKHQGKLDFVSNAEQGTTFIIQLPIGLQSATDTDTLNPLVVCQSGGEEVEEF